MIRSPLRPAPTHFDRELLQVAAAASAVCLLSFLYCFQRGEILLYGDAVAHINIARRVFDSQTPGLLQLGTVWLPLPHLLMVPFLLSDWMWQTGVGGSIPSMIGYVFGVAGIFRLVRGMLKTGACSEPAARAGAWVAAFAYGANPNLLYLQATAMTESLYLALFIWAVVYLQEFAQGDRGLETRITTKDTKVHEGKRLLLWKCGLCLAGAELTRYDGWVLAVAMGVVVIGLAVRRWEDRSFRRCALKFVVGVAAVPLLWLAYNAAVYGNPLAFANGPYSAKAIEQRTATVNPAANHVGAAASYFLKSAQLDMAARQLGKNLDRGGAGWPGSHDHAAPGAMGLADAVAPPAVLRALDRVWQRAAVCAGVVAVYLVQPAVWTAIAAAVCGGGGDDSVRAHEIRQGGNGGGRRCPG